MGVKCPNSLRERGRGEIIFIHEASKASNDWFKNVRELKDFADFGHPLAP